jgi:hypothetical protein
MYPVKLLLILLTLGFVSCGRAPDMPDYNKSSNVDRLMGAQDEKNFYLLPLNGEVHNQEKFWSGDYWPINKGNINLRWNTSIPEGWDYNSPTRDELLFMTPDQIAQLSAPEKFDLYLGRYDYPLKAEVYTFANRRAQSWEGICNGWAPASMNHNEPTPKSFTNPDGIVVKFGSSDIKALLSYYYAFIHKIPDTQQIGRRCPRGSGWFNWNKDCKNDLDAGAFHVVLANKVGKKNQSFLVDIERYKEVWNHPILSYSTTVDGEERIQKSHPENTYKVLKVTTKVAYVNESRNNSWEPVRGTDGQKLINRVYSYLLFLDNQDQIISGEWTSSERPDFLWVMGPTPEFKGLLAGLGVLLND